MAIKRVVDKAEDLAKEAETFIDVEVAKLERLYAAGRVWLKNTRYRVTPEVAKDLLKMESDGKPFFARFRERAQEVETETVATAPAVEQKAKILVDVVDGKMEVGTKEEEAALDLPPVDSPEDDVVKL